MSVGLSLQGCMAAGKTTAARYLKKIWIMFLLAIVSYENSAPLLQEIKRRSWNQNTLECFVEVLKYNVCSSRMKSIYGKNANNINMF
ncbi:hypothetical protein [Methanosarcina barkeri]|uniref:hypothetical protein n=1 Tax=Methanosarcina barkeri TaxID=2208 RepID=UPI0006943502|nr:hypothetical protein [Methanosarcina barkeri]